VPEYLTFKDFEKEGLPLLRSLLTDDMYFNNKSFITCYCEESFRPKLPSVIQQNKARADFANDVFSEYGVSEQSSPSKILGKLKDAASMAISVTTGHKLDIKKNPNASNIIPGFGYSVLDLFENQYVEDVVDVSLSDRTAQYFSEQRSNIFAHREKLDDCVLTNLTSSGMNNRPVVSYYIDFVPSRNHYVVSFWSW
jgi:hypothetical protein